MVLEPDARNEMLKVILKVDPTKLIQGVSNRKLTEPDNL